MADSNGGRILDIDFSHPSPVWQYIGDGKNLPKELSLNRADQHLFGKKILEIINLKGRYSVFFMRLILEEKELGVVAFGAKGWDRFCEGDFKLIRLLKAPFAIALSNCIRYIELLKMKDLLADDYAYLQNEMRSLKGDQIIGADFGLSHVMQQVRQVAPLSSPVLLTGETGVGKEVIADAIHANSPRQNGPFIKINCGAIPDTLIDSELFGHEEGAFTGATQRRRGRFERAHGGTIFFDEIGELPMNAQVRLLRVLQEKEFEPVGADRSIRVDIRIIAASHRNLEEMAENGNFRQDLYFRLNVFPIHIPPLRERKGDILALVQHFILKKYRELGIRKSLNLADGALERLQAYDWPGNIREFENIVEREIISGNNPLEFFNFRTLNSDQIMIPQSDTNCSSLLIDDVLSVHINRVLHITKGRVAGQFGAAKKMGINPNTLRHKMRKLGIPFGRMSKY